MARRTEHFGTAAAWAGIGTGVIAFATVGAVVGSTQASAKVTPTHPLDLWANRVFFASIVLAIVGALIVVGSGIVAIRGWWKTRKEDGADYALTLVDITTTFAAPNQVSPRAGDFFLRFRNALVSEPIEYHVEELMSVMGTQKTPPFNAGDAWWPIAPGDTSVYTTQGGSLQGIPVYGDVDIDIEYVVIYGIVGSEIAYRRRAAARLTLRVPVGGQFNTVMRWDDRAERPERIKKPRQHKPAAP